MAAPARGGEAHLILVTGAVRCVIAAFLKDSAGSDVSDHSVESLLRLGEVRLVPGRAV